MELSLTFWILVFICCFAQSGFGIGIGFTSPALPLMIQDGTLTVMQGSWFSSTVNLGCMGGSFIAGAIMQGYGRHFTMLLMTLPCVLGWFVISVSSFIHPDYLEAWNEDQLSILRFTVIIGGRLLTGIGFGMCDTIVPTYLSEISPDNLRGACGCLNRVGLATGFVIIYALGMTPLSWQWMSVASMAVSVIVAIALFHLPESPRWYLLRGRANMATDSMRRLSKLDEKDIERALSKIETALFTTPSKTEETNENKSYYDAAQAPKKAAPRLKFDAVFGRTFALICGVLILKQFCGMNAVLSYAETIFNRSGLGDDRLGALILGCVQLASTIVSVLLIDRLGRRPLLLSSALGMAVALTVAGGAEFLSTPMPSLTLAAFLVYSAFFSIGLGPLPNLIMSEIFRAEARGFGSAASLVISNVSRFVTVVTFEPMQRTLQPWGSYWFYAGVCLIGFFCSYAFLPETKNVELEQISAYFERRTKDEEKEETVAILTAT